MTPPSPMGSEGLMLFDGVCNLCDGAVRAVLAMDRAAAIRFVPLQSPYGRQLARLHGLDPERPESFLFLERGRALRKTAAVGAILRRMPAPWRWLAIVDRLPRGLTDPLYDWVAAHRYRLFGRRSQCVVPTERQRTRFLTEAP